MHLQGWKFHGRGSKVKANLVNDINYILIYCGFRMILELQANFLAKPFVNGIITFGVIVFNPIIKLLCLGTTPPRATPCKVPISLTIKPSPMFGWSILKTFMTCLQIMPCAIKGQSHCDHSKVGAWTVYIFPRWLVDATNVMSSPSRCNRTFVSKMSQA